MIHDQLAIRPATPNDAAAISALLLSLAKYCTIEPDGAGAEGFLSTFQPPAILALLANPAYQYLVGMAGDALAGVVAIREHAHLYHLFVAERFHGRGYASQLWAAIDSAARAAGNPGRYTVNSSLNAVPVYQAFGFALAGAPLAENGIAYVPMTYPAQQRY